MARVIVAFATIYVVWGSSYLAIRVAVEAIPPLLMMGLRSLAAGALLYGWARARGASAPGLTGWMHAGVAGALFFLVCHGGLAWAEQRVSSGLAALLMATIPLWMAVLDWALDRRIAPSPRVIAGLALGFLGAAALVGPGASAGTVPIDLTGGAVLLVAALSWAAGSLYARSRPVSKSVPLAAGTQLLAGGALLCLGGAAAGEWDRFPGTAAGTLPAFALVYLIVFASIAGFCAYHWLLRETSLVRLSTYAYVNPVIALVLGWGLADESVDRRAVGAAVLILAGVALVVSGDMRHPARRSVAS